MIPQFGPIRHVMNGTELMDGSCTAVRPGSSPTAVETAGGIRRIYIWQFEDGGLLT